MNDPVHAYPLAWPAGWKRTTGGRSSGKFNKKSSSSTGYRRSTELNPADGALRVLDELSKLGVERHNIVISTNLKLRMDGLPKDDNYSDPGVALYWTTRKGERRCMAADAYMRPADNLAAIAATLEALRAIERHGGAPILDRAFTGFTALPSNVDMPKPWYEVLGVPESASREAIQDAFRRAAMSAHPDRGGTDAAMASLSAARDEGLRHTAWR